MKVLNIISLLALLSVSSAFAGGQECHLSVEPTAGSARTIRIPLARTVGNESQYTLTYRDLKVEVVLKTLEDEVSMVADLEDTRTGVGATGIGGTLSLRTRTFTASVICIRSLF